MIGALANHVATSIYFLRSVLHPRHPPNSAKIWRVAGMEDGPQRFLRCPCVLPVRFNCSMSDDAV